MQKCDFSDYITQQIITPTQK